MSGGGVSLNHISPAAAPSTGCRPMLRKSGVTVKAALAKAHCMVGAALTKMRGADMELLSITARTDARAPAKSHFKYQIVSLARMPRQFRRVGRRLPAG